VGAWAGDRPDDELLQEAEKMVHAALLLLMLEAGHNGPRFTISLKRSTQKSSSYPQAGPADYSISWGVERTSA
jgi:hypothetical protein